jgi:hypothetical protein
VVSCCGGTNSSQYIQLFCFLDSELASQNHFLRPVQLVADSLVQNQAADAQGMIAQMENRDEDVLGPA